MTTVSVVIPTYNRREFVREAIASVLAQTYENFELIVVDDGSEDHTIDDLRQLSGEFDRVRYIRQANRGVSVARNRGVSESRGDLLAFLDSDDFWQPCKLEAQVRFFSDYPWAQICQTEEIWLRREVRVNPAAKHRKPSGHIFDRCLERCVVSPSAVALRRSLFDLVGGFDEALPACEDYDLWLRIAARTPVYLLPKPLVVKRGGHPDQLSHRYWGMDRFRVIALQKLLRSDILQPDQRRSAAATLREKCAILAAGATKRGKDPAPYLAAAAACEYAESAAVGRGAGRGT